MPSLLDYVRMMHFFTEAGALAWVELLFVPEITKRALVVVPHAVILAVG